MTANVDEDAPLAPPLPLSVFRRAGRPDEQAVETAADPAAAAADALARGGRGSHQGTDGPAAPAAQARRAHARVARKIVGPRIFWGGER